MAENPDFEFPGRNIKWGQHVGGTDIAGKYPNAVTVSGLSGMSISSGYVLGNNTASSGAPTGVTLTSIIDRAIGSTAENILQRHGGSWSQVSLSAAIDNAIGSTAENILQRHGGSWSQVSLSAAIDNAIGSTQGDLLYRGVSSWSVLAPGTSGQLLKTQGSGANPTWSSTSQTWEGEPGGRLSLTSATAVQTADVSGGTTVYYVPFIHNKTPYFIGKDIGTSLSLALDSNSLHTGYQQSGKLFDFYLYNDSGTLRLVTGPAWTSTTARGTGAGTTELDLTTYPGLPTNKNSMTAKYDATSSTLTIAANGALYVGTMYASANGQCSCVMNPAGTGGGGSAIIGYSNQFNRVLVSSTDLDNTSLWTYNSTTWRAADNNSNNGIRIVNCNVIDMWDCTYIIPLNCGASGDALIGIGLDSTTSQTSATYNSGSANVTSVVNWRGNIGLGFHTIYPIERQATTTSSATFFGVATASTQTMRFTVLGKF